MGVDFDWSNLMMENVINSIKKSYQFIPCTNSFLMHEIQFIHVELWIDLIHL